MYVLMGRYSLDKGDPDKERFATREEAEKRYKEYRRLYNLNYELWIEEVEEK